MMDKTQDILSHARVLGFDLAGVASAAVIASDHVDYLRNWLSHTNAGEMSYMHRNLEKRINPALLLDGAKSVICVAINYKPNKQSTINGDKLKIACYATYEDYHLFIKKKLRLLGEYITAVHGACNFKICVDSVPLAERALAVAAGLGFIGKNHMLINPVHGPWLVLGELITDIQLAPSQPQIQNVKSKSQNCDSCSACIRACPTGAITGDGFFDARKCVSYLTIEHKTDIAADLREKLGNNVFGCDACITACPWSRCAPPRANTEFKQWLESAALDGHELLSMTAAQFESSFADTPLYRTGLERLRRNARLCMANIKSVNHCR